ncbi:MAG TPA: VTT domain-containing protein [Solirubrobacteraceae bacterium]|nr:VTT domain-containing protein [Solirubrobacteraceae bacterium]
MFDDLSDLSDSPASYLAVLALVALDAVFPVAPSETVLVTGGIPIERGDLIAPVFVLAAACGAVLGDSILFGLGSRAGPGLRAKLFSSERARERLRVVERLVHARTWLLIVSDFVPGGRTAAMFAAGALRLPAPASTASSSRARFCGRRSTPCSGSRAGRCSRKAGARSPCRSGWRSPSGSPPRRSTASAAARRAARSRSSWPRTAALTLS